MFSLMMMFACLVSLNGGGGRHEDAGGESEVTETLQHQVQAGGQSHLGSIKLTLVAGFI